MLRRYFEKTSEDNSYLFDGLKITGAGYKYKSYMEQYPVINISLKSMKQTSFEESFFEYQTLIIEEFEKNQYKSICSRTAYKTSYATALRLLSKHPKKAYKTNDSLKFAVLTGCLRISKESIFTGLNNLNVYPVTDNAMSKNFGFTEQEVKQLTDYYNLSDEFDIIKKWYDGYLFGET